MFCVKAYYPLTLFMPPRPIYSRKLMLPPPIPSPPTPTLLMCP
uniref:Uncharacterized protein n=1 Tax=Rhizophora mucronata TaxID=61149 RepID=A0A2P2J378_RHIMU